MTTQQQQFLNAAEQYIARTRQDEAVIGILITGSFVHGQLDIHSDLDIYVILDPDCQYRERGNTWIEGVEVEYFMNPPQQIRAYMRQEKSPHTAHMLTHGKLAFCKNEVVLQLIEEARALLAVQPPVMEIAVPLESIAKRSYLVFPKFRISSPQPFYHANRPLSTRPPPTASQR